MRKERNAPFNIYPISVLHTLQLCAGLLKVDESLQVQGCAPATVWAVGDVTNLKETKLAYYGGVQAALVVKNIKAAATVS
jgi:hypothetical protein